MALYRYPCLIYRQRQEVESTPIFCLFHAPVGEILTWAAIKRLEAEAGAPQRRASPAKVRAIKNFLKNEPQNTIPSSVILTIDFPHDKIKSALLDQQNRPHLNWLEFEMAEDAPKPGLIIDGQHRLLGMEQVDPGSHLNVVALLNADETETAFQFLVINHKASKVSSDHIRALALHYEKQQLDNRLKAAQLTLAPNLGLVGRVDSEIESPFRGIIAWPTNPKAQRLVLPSAIEVSIAYLQQQKLKPFESDEILLAFFYAIWRTLKNQWAFLWKKNARLLSKVGIWCLTQYITDALIAVYDWRSLDISDSKQVTQKVEVLLTNQEPDFWEVPWISISYNKKAGRALILEALIQIARNLHTGDLWYAKVKLVDITPLVPTLASGNAKM